MAVLIYPLTLRYGILGTGIAAAFPSALVLVLVFSIGLGAVSYGVFLWLTQKEEFEEIKRIITI